MALISKRISSLAFATLLACGILASSAMAAGGSGDSSAKAHRSLKLTVGSKYIQAAKALAKPYGSLSKAKDGSWILTLNPGVNPEVARAALDQHREFSRVAFSDQPITGAEMRSSVSGLQELISRFRSDSDELNEAHAANRKAKAHLSPQSEKDGGPDYLRALQYFVDRRAYPYDRMDWNAYNRAVMHEMAMPNTLQAGNGGVQSLRQRITPSGTAPITGVWQFVGPKNLNTPYRIYYGVRPSTGRTNAIAYDYSNTNTIYIGGGEGGVWKTTDGGVNWKPLSNKWPYQPVSAITLDPVNHNTIYVGTGDYHGGVGFNAGVMKSTDGGTTWIQQGANDFGNTAISAVLVDPETPATVTVTTNGQVWRSTNAGTSWTPVITVNAGWSSASMSIADSSKVRHYYAAGGGASGGNIYRSDDRGATWTKLTSPASNNNAGNMSIAASGVDSKTVYLLDQLDSKIFKSTDMGGTWTDITGNFPSGYNWSQAWYDYYITCFNNNGKDDIIVGLIDVVESTDGTTWNSIGQTYTGGAITHNDQHSVAVNPSNPNEVLFGNDGGVYKGTRSGGAWTINGLSKTLGLTMFYDAVWDNTDPTKMVGGSQDNATPVSTGDLANWGNVGGGDGGFVAIDQANKQYQYCTIYNLTVIETTDGWNTQQDISPSTNGDNLPFVTPIYSDPVNTKYLYACSNYLYRFDNTTQSWTNRLGGQQLSNGSLIHAVAVAPSNGNIIYTGSDDGQLFVSRDGGTTFTNITSGAPALPNRSISCISVDPKNPNSILVGLSGSGTAHLVQCTDTTATSRAFNSVSGSGAAGLPDISLNCISRDLNNPSAIWYVGTDVGVFMSPTAGAGWVNYTQPLGLPIVQVESIQAMAYGNLNIATYGRGIWKLAPGVISGGGSNGKPPSSFAVIAGSVTSGNLQSLAADDGNYLTMLSSYDAHLGSQTEGISATYTGLGAGPLSAASVSITSVTNVPATIQVFAFNTVTRGYTLINTYASTLSPSTTTSTISTNVAQYMANGTMTIVVRSIVPGRQQTGGTTLKIDSALLTAN